MSEPIQHEVSFPATPARIYGVLMDSAQHAEFTGGGACEISPEPGGAFSCHGGRIVGRNIELVADQRIVQAWRPANWPEGVYSIVRFELREAAGKTHVTLTHSGVPDEFRDHIDEGWKERYWKPLARYLA